MADGSKIVLWDMRNPRQPRRLGTTDGAGLGPIQFTRDGDTLLGVDSGRTLRLRDVTDPLNPRVLSKLPTEHTGAIARHVAERDLAARRRT